MNDVSAIRISTKLKTDGIARDRKLLEKELSRVAKDAEKANITKEITKNNEALSNTESKLAEINKQYRELEKNTTRTMEKATARILKSEELSRTPHAAGSIAVDNLSPDASEYERTRVYAEAYNQTLNEMVDKRLLANQEYQESIAKLEELKTSQETLTKEEQTQLNTKEQLNAQLEIQNQLIAEEQAKLNSQIGALDVQKQKLDEKKLKEIESIKNAKDLDTALKNQGKSIQNGLKKLMGFGMALLGVRAAYSGIRKVVNEVLSQNDQLKNTLDGIWSTLGNAFTPIITSLISGFATVLNYALAILNALTGINLLAKSTKKNTGGAAKEANRLASFDSSEVLSKSGGGGASGTNATLLEEIKLNEGVLAVLERIKAMWNGILGVVSNLGKGIQKAWNYAGNGERIMKSLNSMGNKLLSFFERIIRATLTWSESLDFIPLFSSLAGFIEELADSFGFLMDIGAMLYEQVILPIASWVIESGLPAFLDLLGSALSVLNSVLGTIMPVWDWFYNNLLKPIASWTGGAVITVLTTLSDALRDIGSWFTDNAEGVQETLINLGERILWLWEEIIRPVLDLIKIYWSSTFAFIGGVIKGLLDTAKGVIDSIMGVFDGLIIFLDGLFSLNLEKALLGVKMIFANIWNGIISIVEGAINGIIYGVNAVIRGLNKISIKMPSWLGGGTFGFSLEEMQKADLSRFKIEVPGLATGAVLPPNKPFLAMLGDQTTGRNIETPESLLRQIIQEENAGNNPILNLILDGDTAQIMRFFKIELQKEDERTGITLVEEGI